MYNNDRNAYRQTYFDAWQKYQKKLPLEALEIQLIEIMLLHPAYFSVLENPQQYQTYEFLHEENPFLHMSLHLAIREQLNTNRPQGITQIHQALLNKYHHPHEVEHYMLACLASILQEAQQKGVMPDEEDYLKRLREI